MIQLLLGALFKLINDFREPILIALALGVGFEMMGVPVFGPALQIVVDLYEATVAALLDWLKQFLKDILGDAVGVVAW